MVTSSSGAPGDLELVRSFINTLDVEEGTDSISSSDGLRSWLRERGLMGPRARVGPADVRRARETREALRSLILANDGGPTDRVAIGMLNEVSRRAPLAVRFGAGGRASLEARVDGVDGAIARLLAIVEGAMVDGTWKRLKACRNDACRWAFYDRSKNRSGTWCTMSVCGNLMKARAYRRRRARAV